MKAYIAFLLSIKYLLRKSPWNYGPPIHKSLFDCSMIPADYSLNGDSPESCCGWSWYSNTGCQ